MASRSVRDAGGNRTHFRRVAAGRLAIWLQRPISVPARNRTWSTSFAGSRAIQYTSRTNAFSTPPRNRTPSRRFEVCDAVHHTRRASKPITGNAMTGHRSCDMRPHKWFADFWCANAVPFPETRNSFSDNGPPGSRTPITWVQTKCLPVGPTAHAFRCPIEKRTSSSVVSAPGRS